MSQHYQILVVDDDFSIVNIIETALKQEGYLVLTAYDGEEACRILEKTQPHLIIMDVMMPRLNGLLATMKIRKDSNVPILMLSAKAEGTDRVLGLEAGSDDYLVKPFSFEELMARVRAMTRKTATNNSPVYQLADLKLDTNTHNVSRGDISIRLSAKEFALLEYMLRNKGTVLSRENIENNLWNFDYEGGTNAVDVYIRYLRKKIHDNFQPKLIHTVRGVGYVIRED